MTFTPQKRIQLVNEAIKVADPKATPVTTMPQPTFRLTPSQLSNNGAYIEKLGIGRIGIGTVDGNLQPATFVFQNSPAPHVMIKYPAERGRIYVIDCTVTDAVSMTAQRQGTTVGTARPNADHMIVALRSDGVAGAAHLTFDIGRSPSAVFKGCDVTKL
jgi:hypothetical protein